MKNVCVFVGSSDSADTAYLEATRELGKLIAKNGHTLIWGGCALGLMEEVARAAKLEGGRIIGVVPRIFQQFSFREADSIVITDDFAERKRLINEYSDAYVALPGGFGTLEEISDILVDKQLQIHSKPLILINTNAFYNHFLLYLENKITSGFAKPDNRKLFWVASSPREALDYIATYTPASIEKKLRGI